VRGVASKIDQIVVPLACVVAFATACSSFGGSTSDEHATSDTASHAQTEEAIAALKGMSEFLASRPAIRFAADIHYDAIQPSGQKIEFGSRRRIALRRPDRARVEVSHWDGEQELLTFDGKRLSAVIPGRRIYASMEYTGTVSQAFEHLVTEYGVASPLSDLLRRDLPDEVARRVLSGRRLEAVTIAGTRCDHLAFHGERVDFQLFIRQGDEPVPLRFVIDYHAEPGSPQFRAQLRDWDWQPELPDLLFRFVPPAGAQRVAFAELLDLLLGPLDTEEGGP
jgi:hypothetical protein